MSEPPPIFSSPPAVPWNPPPRFGPQRPGVVTFIAVLSLIVSGVNMLGGMVNSLYVLGMYRVTQVTANQSRSVMANTGSASPLISLPSPDELETQIAAERKTLAERRVAIADLFESIRPLTTELKSQLNAILSRGANRILPPSFFSAGTLTTRDLRKVLVNDGTLLAGNPALPTPIYFDFDTGRLELRHDGAVFRPKDGSETVRASAADAMDERGMQSTGGTDSAIGATTAPVNLLPMQVTTPEGPMTVTAGTFVSGLTGQQIHTVLQKAQSAAGNKLTLAQVTSLQTALQTGVPPLVQPQQVWSPVRSVMVSANGTAGLFFSGGSVVVDSSGMILSQATTAMEKVHIHPVGMTLLIGDAILSSILSIFLLVIGIMVLRESPRGAGLHWLYALIKIPMTILSWTAFLWVLSDLTGGIARLGSGSPNGEEGFITFATVMGLVAIGHPILLMILLSTRTVKDYYRTMTA